MNNDIQGSISKRMQKGQQVQGSYRQTKVTGRCRNRTVSKLPSDEVLTTLKEVLLHGTTRITNDKESRRVVVTLRDKMFKKHYNEYIDDPDNTSNEKITPLMYVCRHGNKEAFEFLRKNKKVDLTAKTESGKTALHFALSCNYNPDDRKYIAQKLSGKKKHEALNAKDEFGNTPIHVAFSAGFSKDSSLIKKMIKQNEVFNNKNDAKLTPVDLRESIIQINSELDGLNKSMDMRQRIFSAKEKFASSNQNITLMCFKPDSASDVEADEKTLIETARSTMEKLYKCRPIQECKFFGSSQEFNLDAFTRKVKSLNSNSIVDDTDYTDNTSEVSCGNSSSKSICPSIASSDGSRVANLDDFSGDDCGSGDEYSYDEMKCELNYIKAGKTITEEETNAFNDYIKQYHAEDSKSDVLLINELTDSFIDVIEITGWTFKQAFPACKMTLKYIQNQSFQGADSVTDLFYSVLEKYNQS